MAVQARVLVLVQQRPQQENQVEVYPGETWSEVLEKIGITNANDWVGKKPDANENFKPGDEVFPHLNSSTLTKIHINLVSSIGAKKGWLKAALTSILDEIFGDPSPKRDPLPITIQKNYNVRTYAQDEGWKSEKAGDATLHQGYYYAANKRWAGRVIENGDNLFFKILCPPISLIKQSPWDRCFNSLTKDGWYSVGFYVEPKDAGSGIKAINDILDTLYTKPRHLWRK